MEAVLLVGLQGSGKASFYLARFFQTHIRLSLDMVRTRHRQNLLVRACIEAKQPFVLDNTNVTRTERAPYLALARAGRFRVVGFYVDTPVGECLRRNELRERRARSREGHLRHSQANRSAPAGRRVRRALSRPP